MKEQKPLLKVARKAIEAFLNGERAPIYERFSETGGQNPDGIFVTLWAPGGELRGCIGRHHREFPNLVDEVADCAILSATEDPRFPPVSPEELPGLSFEISLLEKPEPVQSFDELDSAVFGVIVESGHRRATLLPGIDGVDTVEKQTQIVLRKAGISDARNAKWYRFRVRKVSE